MSSSFVIPGQVLTTPDGYLRGHGTFMSSRGDLHSSVSGVVERVNKLVSVQPFKSRYGGNVGDVIVGRITEVGNKRWKLDVNARQEAVLLLGSVNLPGGAQRRRTMEDRLQMRQLFAENDVVCCEVSSFYKDGGMSVQTRSLKYGKLENGQVVQVPPHLVQRVKHHFVTLRCGVDLVLGHNGYVWITSSVGKLGGEDGDEDEDDAEASDREADEAVADTERSRMISEMEAKREFQAKRVIPVEERMRIARVLNSILLIVQSETCMITPTNIERIYEESLALAPHRPSDMLLPHIGPKIFQNFAQSTV